MEVAMFLYQNWHILETVLNYGRFWYAKYGIEPELAQNALTAL